MSEHAASPAGSEVAAPLSADEPMTRSRMLQLYEQAWQHVADGQLEEAGRLRESVHTAAEAMRRRAREYAVDADADSDPTAGNATALASDDFTRPGLPDINGSAGSASLKIAAARTRKLYDFLIYCSLRRRQVMTAHAFCRQALALFPKDVRLRWRYRLLSRVVRKLLESGAIP